MVAAIKSVGWPRSHWNAGRDQIGIPGRLALEFAVQARAPQRRAPGSRTARPVSSLQDLRLHLTPAAALRVSRDLVREAGISADDSHRLLGLPPERRALPAPDALTEEQLQRIHYLLDITTSLRAARDQATANDWLTAKDRGALKGYAPVQHMIQHGLKGFAEIRQLADALANE